MCLQGPGFVVYNLWEIFHGFKAVWAAMKNTFPVLAPGGERHILIDALPPT